MSYNHEMQQQLEASLELLKTILGADLLGVYLYGSAVIGGLQKYSDIDLFVVTGRATTEDEKNTLAFGLLEISGLYMKGGKRPVEMTIVQKASVNPWHYPPHCDFQYGEWLRGDLKNGAIPSYGTGEMPDLALLVTQALLKSQTLWGATPEQLLAPVPYHDFIKGMIHDLDRLGSDLEEDTRNVLLTYARIWSTLVTDEIRSKPAAADWVISRLPEQYHCVMMRVKLICIGKEHEYFDDIKAFIEPCVAFMVDAIYKQMSALDFNDSNKSINILIE